MADTGGLVTSRWLTAALVALVHLTGVVTVLLLQPSPTLVASWWPAAGLAAATVALAPRPWWPVVVPAVAVASGASNLVADRPPLVCVVLGAGVAVEALVVAAVLRRGRPGGVVLDSPWDVVRLIVAAVAGALTISTVLSLVLPLLTGSAVARTWQTVTPSHLAAILVVVPLAVSVRRPGPPSSRAELAVQTSLLLAVTVATFWAGEALALTFFPLPLLVWAGFRFGVRTVTWQVALLAVLVTLVTARGRGPFAAAGLADVALSTPGALVQSFVACSVLMCLPLAVTVEQRHRLLGTEREARARLAAERELVDATYDTADCLILLADLEGRLMRVNARAAGITGWSEEELLRRRLWEVVVLPEHAAEARAAFEDPANLGVPRHTELDMLAADGRLLRVQWTNSTVCDEDGSPRYVVLTGIDVTAERRATGLTQHMFEAAITTILVGLDNHGVVTAFNTGGEEILGVDRERVIGGPFTDLLDPGQLASRPDARGEPSGFTALAAVVDRDGTATGDWTWQRPDGSPVLVATTLSPVQSGTGARIGYLCVGRDVTEIRRHSQLLVEALEKERAAAERLRQLDAAKDEFVSTVSHELRTPVTTIVGYVEMLRDGSLVEPLPDQRAALEVIQRSSDRLVQLAEDLVTLAALESGRLPRPEEVDLVHVVRAGEQGLQRVLAGRRLDVHFEVPEHPVPVLGDQTHLRRSVDHLLVNAVKFTDDGGRVSCALSTSADSALLTVTDTGMGIPADEQAAMFDKFRRASNAHTRAIQGPGLGLSIVASVVAAHEGSIEVESAENEGATFRVRLPMQRRSGDRAGHDVRPG